VEAGLAGGGTMASAYPLAMLMTATPEDLQFCDLMESRQHYCQYDEATISRA